MEIAWFIPGEQTSQADAEFSTVWETKKDIRHCCAD